MTSEPDTPRSVAPETSDKSVHVPVSDTLFDVLATHDTQSMFVRDDFWHAIKTDFNRPFTPSPERMVERIVKEKLAEYGPTIERMVDLAVKRSMPGIDLNTTGAAGAVHAPHRDSGHLHVKKAIADALSDMPHVLSAAYIPQLDDYWPLFIVHDSDSRGKITEQIVHEIVRVERLPSMPLLALKITHTSNAIPIPDEAIVVFTK